MPSFEPSLQAVNRTGEDEENSYKNVGEPGLENPDGTPFCLFLVVGDLE